MRMFTLMMVLTLTACSESSAPGPVPPPAKLTRDAVAHFCGMLVLDHEGPKGQIFIEGQEQPLWFTSVRDTVAFTLLPEETDKILAIYVNDMARAKSWASPGPGTWMKAQDALYVIGSSRHGGMGAQEAVPFSSRASAEAFTGEYGGHVVAFDQIPRDYILGDAWSKNASGH